MVDKELIENWRNMVKLPISSLLFKTNYEGMGEQDKEEFERDFDEILDLALIGLKHKAQLSQKGTTKGTTSDTISRQAAIDAYGDWYVEEGTADGFIGTVKQLLEGLPPVQPEREKGHWILYDKRFPWRYHYKCSECGNYLDFSGVNAGRGSANFCPNCGADMRGETK